MSWHPIEESKLVWYESGWEACLEHLCSNFPDFMIGPSEDTPSPIEEAHNAMQRSLALFRHGPRAL